MVGEGQGYAALYHTAARATLCKDPSSYCVWGRKTMMGFGWLGAGRIARFMRCVCICSHSVGMLCGLLWLLAPDWSSCPYSSLEA